MKIKYQGCCLSKHLLHRNIVIDVFTDKIETSDFEGVNFSEIKFRDVKGLKLWYCNKSNKVRTLLSEFTT